MVYYSQIILLVTFNILINSKGSVLLDESLYCFRLLLFCQRTSGKILTQHRCEADYSVYTVKWSKLLKGDNPNSKTKETLLFLEVKILISMLMFFL